jgi:hypothetical protein
MKTKKKKPYISRVTHDRPVSDAIFRAHIGLMVGEAEGLRRKMDGILHQLEYDFTQARGEMQHIAMRLQTLLQASIEDSIRRITKMKAAK